MHPCSDERCTVQYIPLYYIPETLEVEPKEQMVSTFPCRRNLATQLSNTDYLFETVTQKLLRT